MKKLFLVIAFLLIATPAFAATKYFIDGGVDNDWSGDDNWSTESGGANDTTHATSADDVILDDNSPNCTVDTASAAKSINCAVTSHNYANTLTLGANLTVSGNLTFVSGMTFTPSTYKVTFSDTGTIASGGKIFNDVDFTGNAKTHTINGTVRIDGTVSFSDAAGPNSYFDGINTPVFDLRGNATATGTNANARYSGSNTIIDVQFNGSNHTFTGGTSPYCHVPGNLKINCSGTFTFSGTVLFSKDVTHVSGTVAYGTSKCGYGTTGASTAPTITSNAGALKFYDFTSGINKQLITLVGDLYIENDLLQAGAHFGFTSSSSTIVYVKRNITTTNNIYVLGYNGSANVSIQANGDSDQVIGDTNGLYLGNHTLVINSSGGTVYFKGTLKIYSSAGITYTAGTVDCSSNTHTLSILGSCTLNTNGMSWYNITHSATNTTTFSSDLTLTNTLAINANTIYSGAYNVHAQGAITRDSTARTLTSANTTLLIDGGANQSIGTTNGMNFLLPVTVNKSGNTATMAAEIDFGNGTNTPTFTLTSAQSTLAWGTSLLKCIANANLNCGTVYQLQVSTAGTTTLTGNLTATSTVTIDASRTLNIQANTLTLQGDCVNNGTLTASSGTVALTGSTAKQSFTGNNITFGTFQCIAPTVNKEICFLSGKTYTFNTALTLISSYGGNSLTLSASTPDTVTNFDIDAACTQTIERVIVVDNDASAGETGHDYKGTITDAQNVNWDDVAPSTPTPTAYAWIG